MKRYLGISMAAFCSLLLVAGFAVAKPTQVHQDRSVDVTPGDEDLVGDVDGTNPMPAKALQDTVWIADWTFDSGSGCASVANWTQIDNRILNNGSNYWHIGSTFNGTNGIVNNAAILSSHNLCWAVPDGYGSNWDYSIICKYKEPAATISFNFVSDSEPGFDYFMVEADSAGASEARVNYNIDPSATDASVYRDNLLTFSGVSSIDVVTGLVLPDYGVAGNNEVYLHFTSDGGYDDEDGYYPSNWGAGAVVDNIVITGTLAYSEDFEAALNANITMVNSANSNPFGTWARLYQHITDNDRCVENTTCAWLWSDPLRLAFFPDMSFGPGGAVMHNWLDDIIISPWVSLASTPSATGTTLAWRRNAATRTTQSMACQQWSVRSRTKVDNTDTSTTGDSLNCVTPWGHASSWNTFNSFVWGTNIWDMSSYVGATAQDVQVRIRLADTQLPYLFGDPPPATLNPGPGPYNDRVRVGRRVLSGPVWNIGIDTRTQAQDCFPTQISSVVPQGVGFGHHVEPNTDTTAPLYPYLFGTCDFSEGTELGINKTSPNLITGDSIQVGPVVDARGVGGLTSLKWYGAIVAGPHAGKCPAPYTVGANGFFEVTADSVRTYPAGTWVSNFYFVSLDDYYFRGGDKLLYFWVATDAAGAKTSYPTGFTAANFPPASVTAAELLLNGLEEVSFLPTINWDATYLAAIAADDYGDVAPTAAQVAGSEQKNCILYYQHNVMNRRSGDTNRTSFMYAMDRLGYRGYYDVFDNQGYGNTNNQVGSRATVAQASGYALIIQDSARGTVPDTPDGLALDGEKINQCGWYRSYLAQGLTGRAGTATLWIIGENTAAEKPTNPLFSTDLGLATIATDQGLAVNPDVSGVANYTTWDGCSEAYTGDLFSLNGGCPSLRAYDKATASAGATITHKYKAGSTVGDGAIIMNKNVALRWNTVWMGFAWFDIRNTTGTPSSPDPSIKLMKKILDCVLPAGCRRTAGVVGLPDETDALPKFSTLHQNVPNPFNPTTTIKFDLAHDGHVKLQIFDVAGHTVKTLVNGSMKAGRDQSITWNGLNEAGNRIPSGVYFYQLVTDDMTATKKMVMMK